MKSSTKNMAKLRWLSLLLQRVGGLFHFTLTREAEQRIPFLPRHVAGISVSHKGLVLRQPSAFSELVKVAKRLNIMN